MGRGQASWTFEDDIPRDPAAKRILDPSSTDVDILCITSWLRERALEWFTARCPDDECEFQLTSLNRYAASRTVRRHIYIEHTEVKPKNRRSRA